MPCALQHLFLSFQGTQHPLLGQMGHPVQQHLNARVGMLHDMPSFMLVHLDVTWEGRLASQFHLHFHLRLLAQQLQRLVLVRAAFLPTPEYAKRKTEAGSHEGQQRGRSDAHRCGMILKDVESTALVLHNV